MKKGLMIGVLAIFLVLAISPLASAALFDSIENFFTGGWESYEKTISFVLLFFLFFATFLMGSKKAMGELSRPAIILSLAIAILASTTLVITDKFTLEGYAWIAVGLLFLLVVSAVHTMLIKMGMENHKVLAFFLAFLITSILFFLVWYMSTGGGKFSLGGGGGRGSGWFSGIGDFFRGLGSGGGGAPEPVPVATVPIPQAPKVEEQGWFSRNYDRAKNAVGSNPLMFLLFMVPLLAGGGFLAYNRVKRAREGKAGKQAAATTETAGAASNLPGSEKPFEILVKRLRGVMKGKEEILRLIDVAEEEKKKIKKVVGKLLKAFGKEKSKFERFINEYVPYLRDPSSKQFKDMAQEAQGIPKLVVLSIAIIKYLKALLVLEQYILHHIPTFVSIVDQTKFSSDEKENTFLRSKLKTLFHELHKKTAVIVKAIKDMLGIEEAVEITGKKIGELLKPEHIEERVKKTWIRTTFYNEDQLLELIHRESMSLEFFKKSIQETETLPATDKLPARKKEMTQNNLIWEILQILGKASEKPAIEAIIKGIIELPDELVEVKNAMEEQFPEREKRVITTVPEELNNMLLGSLAMVTQLLSAMQPRDKEKLIKKLFDGIDGILIAFAIWDLRFTQKAIIGDFRKQLEGMDTGHRITKALIEIEVMEREGKQREVAAELVRRKEEVIRMISDKLARAMPPEIKDEIMKQLHAIIVEINDSPPPVLHRVIPAALRGIGAADLGGALYDLISTHNSYSDSANNFLVTIESADRAYIAEIDGEFRRLKNIASTERVQHTQRAMSKVLHQMQRNAIRAREISTMAIKLDEIVVRINRYGATPLSVILHEIMREIQAADLGKAIYDFISTTVDPYKSSAEKFWNSIDAANSAYAAEIDNEINRLSAIDANQRASQIQSGMSTVLDQLTNNPIIKANI